MKEQTKTLYLPLVCVGVSLSFSEEDSFTTRATFLGDVIPLIHWICCPSRIQ